MAGVNDVNYWAEVQEMLDDEEVVFAVLEHHLNVIAAVIDEEFTREYAPWQKIYVNVKDWQNLQDPTFKMHFRMSRPKLHDALLVHLAARGRYHRTRTPFDLCLMVGLWILMNMDTFKNAALHFNTSPGVVYYHYGYIIQALREMAPNYITWPSPEERAEIKAAFLDIGGYPDAVGCIDGMHSYVTAPLIEPQAFVNRHHNYSILSQAVVDHELLIRDLYVGEPGSLSDSRMFRRSPLGRNLLENPHLLSEGEHIIGDGGYILTDKVLIPYVDDGALNEAQRYHNATLSAVCSHVERTFGFTKMRLPRLKYFRSLRIENAVDHITACFVLHNFIILNGGEAPQFHHPHHPGPHDADEVNPDDPDPIFNLDPNEIGGFPDVNAEPDHHLLAAAQIRGEEKREVIADRLFRNR